MDIVKLFDRIYYDLSNESHIRYEGYSPNPNAKPCTISGCKNTIYANGLCNAHYLRKKNGKNMDAPLRHTKKNEADRICKECGIKTNSKGGWGLCKAHYRKRRREVIRKACIEEMGNKCMKCGGTFPNFVYDFHHRDPKEKEDALGNYIDSWSVMRMAEEVVKCDLLCANCHRIEHHER